MEEEACDRGPNTSLNCAAYPLGYALSTRDDCVQLTLLMSLELIRACLLSATTVVLDQSLMSLAAHESLLQHDY